MERQVCVAGTVTKLPREESYVECRTYEEVADAIKRMVIRGAPAIGVAAAMGIALGAINLRTDKRDEFIAEVKRIAGVILGTRPTPVNLAWAVKRMLGVLDASGGDVEQLKSRLVEEARCGLRGRVGTAPAFLTPEDPRV